VGQEEVVVLINLVHGEEQLVEWFLLQKEDLHGLVFLDSMGQVREEGEEVVVREEVH
jgi:hypothetical protein